MYFDKNPKEFKISKFTWSVIISLIILLPFLLYIIGVDYKQIIGITVFVAIICSIIVIFTAFISFKIGTYIKKETDILAKNLEYKGIRKLGIIAIIFSLFFLRRGDLILLIIGILWLVAGCGLLMLKKWARFLFISLAIASILFLIINLLSRNIYQETNNLSLELGLSQNYVLPIAVLFVALLSAFYIFCIVYLNRPKIKEKFK